MSRYIDADALIEMLHKKVKSDYEIGIYTHAVLTESFIQFVEKQPTADVVEVVRCKDCKYWQDNNGGYPHEECRWGKGETPDADDYCSYGERRE